MPRNLRGIGFSLPVILGLILLGALVLRIYRIDHQSFWADEILTLNIAPLPWSKMAPRLVMSESGKPPLYYLLMHQWLPYGKGELWARLPSALLGAATCVVAGLLGRFLLGTRGWLVGLLLALSPFHIWYSQETRMYALLGFLGSVAFYFHFRFCRNGKIVDLILFSFSSILTCYSYPYGFFLLAVTAVSAVLYVPRLSSRRLLMDGVAHIIPLASFIPWIYWAISTALAIPQHYKGKNLSVLGYSFNNLFFGSSIGLPPESLHQGFPLHAHPVGSVILLLALLTSALVFVVGMRILWRDNWNAFVFCAAGFVVFLGGPFLIALVKTSITNNPRYAFLALFPAMLVVAAFLLEAFKRPSLVSGGLTAAFLVGICCSLWNYFEIDSYSRDNMRAAALAATQDEKIDFVFVCGDYAAPNFIYYYKGGARVIPIVFKTNINAGQEAAEVKTLAPHAKYPALIYIRPDVGDPENRLPQLFQSLFRAGEAQRWTGVTLYKYHA